MSSFPRLDCCPVSTFTELVSLVTSCLADLPSRTDATEQSTTGVSSVQAVQTVQVYDVQLLLPPQPIKQILKLGASSLPYCVHKGDLRKI